MKRSLQNNIRTIYLMGFFQSFLVVLPVFVPLLGYALDSLGMRAALLVLLLLFTPPAGLVLVPLVTRIRRERVGSDPEVMPSA